MPSIGLLPSISSRNFININDNVYKQYKNAIEEFHFLPPQATKRKKVSIIKRRKVNQA